MNDAIIEKQTDETLLRSKKMKESQTTNINTTTATNNFNYQDTTNEPLQQNTTSSRIRPNNLNDFNEMENFNDLAASSSSSRHQSARLSTYASLDPCLVSSWLDNHPEFLNDYLRKLQIQRRISIMNDKSGSLLANLHSNLRMQTQIMDFSQQSLYNSLSSDPNGGGGGGISSSYSSSLLLANNHHSTNNNSSNLNNNRNSLNFPPNSHLDSIDTIDMTTTTATKRPQLKYLASPTTSALLKQPTSSKFSSQLNASFSEPNLPPIVNSSSSSHFPLLDKQQFYHHLVPARKKFKQLSLYEKMYTLVKTLYQSLDLKTTCKKILNTVSLLLDADRCSLFLVVDDEKSDNKKCLVSVVFDAQSTNSFQNNLDNLAQLEFDSIVNNSNKDANENTNNNSEEQNDEQIKIPYGLGIVGYVASTGQALNIPDAYLDSRFNSAIDQKTGYKTKSILCLPILNEHGECIAVAEAINKSNDDLDEKSDSSSTNSTNSFNSGTFTEQDEEIFAKFMPFISIAIRNSNLYAQSRKEAQTNKVLLELATIVFDESSTTVDNLVSRILFNSLFLLECQSCQVILLDKSLKGNSRRSSIIKNVSNRFERVYELSYNELSSNEAFSYGILVKPKSEIHPYNLVELDIINSVIESGEILNIQNLKEHPEYAFLNEAKSANSLLCIPVINSADEVVALIFACDKIKSASLSYFSQSDINVAKAFALFCGIGIQNIMMYEKVVRALNMQQVALDVLSYHVSSNQDEVNRLAEEPIVEPHELGLLSFSFDENTLDDIGTLKACISMFADLGLIETFKIPYEVLCRFFLTVKKNYRPVAYHNWRHGFNVMSSMYVILTIGKYREVFNDLEIFSLLIACICHDLDHRGTTNNFQIKIQSPLAKLYTTSTMEHHHFNQCIIILHNNMNNILMNLTPTQHSCAIDIVEKAILATDLALHFKHIDKFLDKANSNNHRFETHEEKDLLLNMLMTACDLSGGTKPWKCHYRLSNLVSSEFFNEGDLEKEKFKKEPIDSMNRNKSDQLPQMQIQFLQSVCIPLYYGLSLCNPILKPLVEACEDNLKEWQKMIKN